MAAKCLRKLIDLPEGDFSRRISSVLSDRNIGVRIHVHRVNQVRLYVPVQQLCSARTILEAVQGYASESHGRVGSHNQTPAQVTGDDRWHQMSGGE